MDAFDLSGTLRRIRRIADLSQRELAEACGLSQSAVARAERDRHDLPARALAIAAGLAGLRLALLDAVGNEVAPMSAGSVTDLSGRRFPAHLDTRRSDEVAGLYEPRRDRPETAFTFTRDRLDRDRTRQRVGTPPDHLRAEPGDSPRERAEARRLEYLRREAAERQRAFLAGELRRVDRDFGCSCPPECEELDDRSGAPVHAEGCPCGCDVA